MLIDEPKLVEALPDDPVPTTKRQIPQIVGPERRGFSFRVILTSSNERMQVLYYAEMTYLDTLVPRWAERLENTQLRHALPDHLPATECPMDMAPWREGATSRSVVLHTTRFEAMAILYLSRMLAPRDDPRRADRRTAWACCHGRLGVGKSESAGACQARAPLVADDVAELVRVSDTRRSAKRRRWSAISWKSAASASSTSGDVRHRRHPVKSIDLVIHLSTG